MLDRTSPVPLQTWYRKWATFAFEHWQRTVLKEASAP